MKHRPYMQEFNHLMQVVTYCSYNSPDHPYKKQLVFGAGIYQILRLEHCVSRTVSFARTGNIHM